MNVIFIVPPPDLMYDAVFKLYSDNSAGWGYHTPCSFFTSNQENLLSCTSLTSKNSIARGVLID